MNIPTAMSLNPYTQQYLQTLQQLAQINTVPQTIAQPVSPPVMHTDLTVINNFDVVQNASVGNGQVLGFILNDESTIVFKEGTSNGSTLTYYDKRPPEKQEDKYVTRQQLEELIAAMTTNKEAQNEPAK